MYAPKYLQAVCCLLLGMICFSSAMAQEKKPAAVRTKGDEFQDWATWNADRWIKVLIDLTVDTDSNHVLDRLSRFQLSASQVKQLTRAADQESSNSKRILLWHAIRMSHDHQGRDYLIEMLVDKSSAEMQIQFIEQLRMPSRFDVPILVALYNSHRPAKKADNDNVSKDKNDGSTAGEAGRKNDAKANDADEKNPLDVPLKIVELTCLTKWNHSSIDNTLTPFREADYDSQAMNQKRLIRGSTIAKEAELAQLAMVHWLIRNGWKDSHRIRAYERFVHVSDFRGSRTIVHNYARDLLRGLDAPESRAQVVPLVSGSIDPSRFLIEDEAEMVRLSAIQAMEKMVIESRKAQSILIFREVCLRYKPVLEMVQNSDTSADVRQAAKLLRGTIAEYEKLDAKEARGELK